ncbi:MAG TPA: hypothetical protein VNW29_07765 [Candidatus Sulfotelmatobacter sp.]|jgi:hypothetical protein|nr:hypothetical protein [Candidatus Sulfotelmatobacter sp.]
MNTITLFALSLLLLLILSHFIDSKQLDDSPIKMEKVQPAYNAQLKQLTDNTQQKNQPVYQIYKWIVKKNN